MPRKKNEQDHTDDAHGDIDDSEVEEPDTPDTLDVIQEAVAELDDAIVTLEGFAKKRGPKLDAAVSQIRTAHDALETYLPADSDSDAEAEDRLDLDRTG